MKTGKTQSRKGSSNGKSDNHSSGNNKGSSSRKEKGMRVVLSNTGKKRLS